MKWDTYTFQARLTPALLVALPVGLLVAACFPNKFVGWGLLVSVLTTFGFCTLLAQIGRDLGKQKEPGLFALWGGKPTTRKLRHATTDLDWITLERCHAKLGAVVGLPPPTAQEEQADPQTADQVYEAYTKYLREATRDRDHFRLVFAENVNYGFRRNLWGMKPSGIVLCVLGTAGSVIAAAVQWGDAVPGLAVVAAALSLVFLVWWVFRINPDWVRMAADAYAERLLCACDSLPEKCDKTGVATHNNTA